MSHVVDEPPMVFDPDRRKAFGEGKGIIELRRNDKSPRTVDVAPFAARHHSGHALGEPPGFLKAGWKDYASLLVDIPPDCV